MQSSFPIIRGRDIKYFWREIISRAAVEARRVIRGTLL